jgi:hypothetical protein
MIFYLLVIIFLGHSNQNQDLEVVKKENKGEKYFFFLEALNRNINEREKKKESLFSRRRRLLFDTHIHHIELGYKEIINLLSLQQTQIFNLYYKLMMIHIYQVHILKVILIFP